MTLILVILLILLLGGGGWGYRSGAFAGQPYGMAGGGFVGVVLLIVVLMLVFGAIR